MTTNKKSVRLPLHTTPLNYNLTLKPDLEAFVFTGVEVIKIKINKNSKTITLHSKDIDIEKVEIENIKNKKIQFANKISYNTKQETATFTFKDEIKKGEIDLKIIFSGIINESLRGFYKSKYEIKGITKHIATTQFEATDARRAFPCFDEPAQKAVFEVSLIIPGTHTAISNTLPISIKEHEAGFKIISFSPTPIMSTYLLAFIIGEFEYIEGYTKDKVQVRVFTTANKKHQAKFALDVAIKSLEFFEKYFDIKYPMPNLDLISIPDFEPAGMENWGAITFRESSILIDEEHSSITNKQWVATTVAHELAHQWFGNLVTMHWWTDLWLNEGFASYMEKVCTDSLFPSWKMWDLYLSNNRYRNAIEIDSLKNSHAIEVEVHHPDEINETFDMVSYEKGTAIIRMLCEYIGEDKFKEGLRYYLKKHSYKNTKTINLWDAFEKISKKPIKKVMNSWTQKAGFPLVRVTCQNKNGFKLTQEKFFSSRITRKKNIKSKLWEIPIIYKNERENKKTLLNKKSINLKEEFIQKINLDESSFIKVNYDKKILENIKNKIENKSINTIDRLGIIRDIFALAEGGYINTIEALNFSLSFKNEKEYIVWGEISYGINKIYNLLTDEKTIENYRNYVLSLYSQIIQDVGFKKKQNEDSSHTLLRILTLSQNAFYGNQKIIKEAKIIFENRSTKPIDPDIRSLVYGIIAKNGGTKEWKILREMYNSQTLNEEKERVSRALTQFNDIKLLEKTLSFAISKEVKDQDAPFLIAATWNNKVGLDLTWQFIKNNWDMILNKYGGNGLLISKFMYLLGNHTTLKDLKDAKKFFSKNVAPGAKRTLEQVYERIESNAAWIRDDKKSIKNWLEKNY